jgi:flavin-dependent dehydrogenase
MRIDERFSGPVTTVAGMSILVLPHQPASDGTRLRQAGRRGALSTRDEEAERKDRRMYDAIVVGARVAGAPTAMLLARAGHRVLLVDRDSFPSDIMSTHYIHAPGVAQLKKWGLLDRVLTSGAPPIARLTITRAGVRLSGMPPYPEAGFTLCPRRTALDSVLVQAAVEAGAELRENFVVEDVLRDGASVTGIRGHQKGGATVEEGARVVIGADGVHSMIARSVHAPEYNTRPALGCGYYAYYDGVPMDGAEVHFLDDCIVFGFPTNDGETCVAVEFPNSRFPEVRADYESAFQQALQRVPEFAARVAQGERVSRFTGVGEIPNFFRKPYGPGWALVGDAGYHKDPVTGLGIMDAFLDAELLAEALDAGFTGRQPIEEALAGYEQRRNERAMPLYEFTINSISFHPMPPEQVMLLKALEGNQEDTDKFLGLNSGVTSMQDFMAPANLGRIIAQAQQRAAAPAG